MPDDSHGNGVGSDDLDDNGSNGDGFDGNGCGVSSARGEGRTPKGEGRGERQRLTDKGSRTTANGND